MRVLVRPARAQLLEIGGRQLEDQMPGRRQVGAKGAHLPLDQAGDRGEIAGAVAELGEEAYHRLGGMVGTDHQPAAGIGDRVLGDHPQPGLDVAEDEILPCGIQALVVFQLLVQTPHVGGDVEGLLLVGRDEGQRVS